MNNTTPLAGFLLALTAAAPMQAIAAPDFVSCHRCTDSQARRAAEGAVPMTHPPGVYDVYVVDTPNNKLRRFVVTAEREAGFTLNHGAQRTPERRYLREFRTGRSEWVYVRDAAKPGIEIPPGFPVDNAEQVIGSAFNQTVISEQINQHIPSRIGSLFGSMLQLFRQIFTFEIQIEVGFPDGSTALFYLDRVDSITSGHMFVYQYKPGSARDSDGNAIPDSPESLANYQGRFTTEPNWERFKRRASRYGADLRRLQELEPARLPAHSICVRDDQSRIYCWNN
jgi:hypothetical protein